MTTPLQNFELFLETAEPIRFVDPPDGGGGHQGKFGVVLLGGFVLLGKPANTVDRGERVVRNEVAAWEAAKLLGVTDMVSTTVLRTFDPPATQAAGIMCSAQVLWPAVIAGQTLANVGEDQVLRAGTFDYLTDCSDRTDNQHNWLVARCVLTSTLFIMLVDNGFS